MNHSMVAAARLSRLLGLTMLLLLGSLSTANAQQLTLWASMYYGEANDDGEVPIYASGAGESTSDDVISISVQLNDSSSTLAIGGNGGNYFVTADTASYLITASADSEYSAVTQGWIGDVFHGCALAFVFPSMYTARFFYVGVDSGQYFYGRDDCFHSCQRDFVLHTVVSNFLEERGVRLNFTFFHACVGKKRNITQRGACNGV